MTLEELHEAIKAGRYYDGENIWNERGEYRVTVEILPPAPDRFWFDTVRGYKLRWLNDATSNVGSHESVNR